MPVTIEVCVDNPQSLDASIAGGADRIELCSALSCGGLTPSRGFIEIAANLAVPVHAMIRPRDGDFDYAAAEIALMKADIRACTEAGLAGIVIGATNGGSLDLSTMSDLIDCAGSLHVTLHRAFDILDEPLRAIDDAVLLGVGRILTSGGAPRAEDCIPQIRSYVVHANDRLSIMAGSGVNAENAARLVRGTGVRDLHGSFSRPNREFDHRLQNLGFANHTGLKVTDGEQVNRTKRAVDHL